jgi:selenide,water dikinase
VQTVDFFSPIVDDPYTFGQIAAANALSDVYAMGAKPLFALNVAGFPSELPLEVLQEVFRGGVAKASEAGVPVLGGHTVQQDEPMYGMVVTGLVHPARVARNAGARVGDQLVLTKPLGTGIVANAAKQDRCPEEVLAAAVASMSALNRGAAEALEEAGADACTDVTGFGLVGHLRGMLAASGVSARIWADRLPLLPQVRELVAAGFVPGGTRRNLAFYEPHLDAGAVAEAERLIACDAQTSGGLLIAVARERLDALLGALRRRGAPAAAHIGEIVDGPQGRIALLPAAG